MFDNKKFESQVRQKLQELDLSPSASVWDKIEAQLPPENKRRIFPFFWRTLIVAAAASVGGYFFLTTKTDSHKDNSTLIATVPATVSGNNTSVKENKLPDAVPALPGGADVSKNHLQTEVSDKNNSNLDQSSYGKRSDYSSGNQTYLKSSNPKTAGFIHNDVADKPKNKEQVKNRNSDILNALENQAGNNDIGSNENALNDAVSVMQENMPAPSIVDGNISYNNTFNVNATIKELDALAKTPIELKKNKRWNFELSLSGGQSIYSNGKVNKLFTAAQPTILNNQSFLPPGNALYAAPPTPSEIKPGNSFSAGINTRYRISKKLSVTAGITYGLLTTQISTGKQYASPTVVNVNGMSRQVAGYYDSGFANDYTNKYHFIEVPVLLYYQLNKGKKLPLLLHGGLSYARLIKTNTLHFDGRANIYYKANELVKKNFVNMEGGFSAKLFAAKKFYLIVGPEIQYGLTNLFTDNVPENNKHSLFIGLKASVPLVF